MRPHHSRFRQIVFLAAIAGLFLLSSANAKGLNDSASGRGSVGFWHSSKLLRNHFLE